MKNRFLLLPFLLVLLALPLLGKTKPKTRRSGATSSGTTRFEFRNVNFRIDDSIVMEIRLLRGELLPAIRGVAPSFDDRRTLLMKIDGGEAAMSTASFTDLMNRYVFNYPNTPLSNIQVGIQGNQIRQTALLHKKVPTEMIGMLDALPDGRIRFHPTSIKAAGVPSKKLMDTLGLKVEKMVKGTEPRGVVVVGDDLIMDLQWMLPPPKVLARVTGVRIEGDRIVQTFGPKTRADQPRDLRPPNEKASNYMYYRGGTIRMRKQIMVDADMQVVDDHPQDPLDYSLTHYYDQLVAGYTKNTPGAAMISFVPDYHQLRGRIAPPGVEPQPGASGPPPPGPGQRP